MAVGVEHLDERVDFEPRAAEDERRVGVLGLEHALERCRLVSARHDVGDLAYARQLARGRGLARNLEPRRALEVAFGDREDARRHRGREERRLAFGRRGLEDGVEILGKAHVEHLVGFVENEDVELVELQRSPADVIERAAGRRDHDIGAPLETADLREHRGPAVERQDRQAPAAGVLVHRLGDLHGKLTRRHEHEAIGAAAILGPERREPMQHRQREGRGLAGPRGRLREQVAALEKQWNRFALHGRRFLVAERSDGRDDRLVEAERGEAGGGRRRWGRSPFRHESPIVLPGACPQPADQVGCYH